MNNLKEKNKKRSEEDLERGYKVVSGGNEINKIIEQEGENYKRIFDKQMPGYKNDLYEDIEIYKTLLNHVENIYLIRNSILGCKIRSLFDSKKCKNWGIIIDEFKNIQKTKNDDSKYVLVGIDQEGLNMPIRLHIKRELLKEFIKSYNGEEKIPVYEGSNDFIINNMLIPTNILMPIQNKQKKWINNKYKDASTAKAYNLKIIEHIRFLKDSSKYPDHLKKEIHTNRGIKLVRPPRKYIDLNTGEVFNKENGEYIKLDSEGKDIDGR